MGETLARKVAIWWSLVGTIIIAILKSRGFAVTKFAYKQIQGEQQGKEVEVLLDEMVSKQRCLDIRAEQTQYSAFHEAIQTNSKNKQQEATSLGISIRRQIQRSLKKNGSKATIRNEPKTLSYPALLGLNLVNGLKENIHPYHI